MISVVNVEVSDDLKFAKIYLSIFSTSKEINPKKILKDIDTKKNIIKYKLGQALDVKYVPKVKFLDSDEYEYFDKINNLINKSINE